jgi:hypothetical protein
MDTGPPHDPSPPFHETAIRWLEDGWATRSFESDYGVSREAALVFAADWLGRFCPDESKAEALNALFAVSASYWGQFDGVRRAVAFALHRLGGVDRLLAEYHASVPGSVEESRCEALMHPLGIAIPRWNRSACADALH